MTALDLDELDQLTGRRLGIHDARCPLCGPTKRRAASQRKPVLRVWRLDPGFATFHCARCGGRGAARDGFSIRVDPEAIGRARAEATERERKAAAERLSKACWLWSKRRPLAGSIVQIYLRDARAYRGPLPATLGYLAPRGDHGAAMIAAFGFPAEPEPGHLALDPAQLRGVHITRLAPDGSGKAGTTADKIMIGRSVGSPIVLAPANDLLGLAIAEGIEDALSVHAATGLGAWAAGAASRLPTLASAIPSYVGSITILLDDDDDGCRHAGELAGRLKDCAFHVRLILPGGNFR